MSFYHLPHPWNPGYAIPKYVMAEPPGRGTFTTKWLPRGTISSLIPDYMAKPGRKLLGRNDADLGSLSGASVGCENSLSGDAFSDGTLSGDSLGAERLYHLESLGDSSSPITGITKQYGAKASAWIMSEIDSVPKSQRKAALKALLDGVDVTLWGSIEAKAAEFASAGMSAKSALAAAIAAGLANGMTNDLMKMGGRARNSQLTSYRDPAMLVQERALQSLGGIGSSISGAFGAAAGFVAKGAKKLGGMACTVVQSVGAEGAGAAMVANPVAGAGVMAAQYKCPKPKGAADGGYAGGDAPAAAGGLPSWALPAAIGGGVLLIIALKK